MPKFPRILSAAGVLPRKRIDINHHDETATELNANFYQFETGTRHIWHLSDKRGIGALLEDSLRDAINYARLSVDHIDFLILSQVWPDNIMGQESNLLTNRMGMTCPSIGINAGTNGGCMAMEIAGSLILSGKYHRIAVVTGCNYGHFFQENDPTKQLLSDGAASMIIGRGNGPEIIASYSASTAHYQALEYIDGTLDNNVAYIRTPSRSGEYLFSHMPKTILDCCTGVCRSANVQLSDIAAFYIYDPVHWVHQAAAKALQIDEKKIFSSFLCYGSLGPTLNTVALIDMAKHFRLRDGQLVITMGFGPTATATACFLRWHDFPYRTRQTEHMDGV
ncbi:3-oxoacyl-[acyl-carrier-protein] synthase III C-terminal domain-containing protein [Lonsdalea populi]|uniref:3-oxoacyl-[acyl-carrier-protein] synthase III C-terminal domain-containing protein n=1 Tax=Lonsdalea populi TaxID=1172565 RepID=UPI000A245F64|nr:3-oxoacyl-[acyl-carrier-protein] synthase III C-terminal domain-containing protein [Lonsdalea populi]OSM94308.1 hypothetical protein AU508_14525 [Lonsdalea populi]RAT70724.1 hypothetical protein AU504_07320 [Lonsdalea populi]RAT73243.1 hypothetical protein AU505_05115 [Lonsdalea populi]RAT75378.1 hypothetical protein AU506_09645 [Lonsdalea populi]RAT79097.1 hypothetical protein AU507_05565 [Lonsdalea populi]